ncbi:serine palmitoyltransferase 2 [Microsporum canis CBS 113480]|uniref:Serine palmitoyltransferase 2 n=1 Tax=Arthroderma otae (strain ATCC MYA-4605 / CBS 113480) TaxID=554155 RepID=C5FR72_ARTOC|nr:serine palmitoyltransferase 2 [Microsporum canis CBS 113480]EEQ32375.1 serine palmitoyltransferase 2 [Microsporum canis CBS 113480]
MPRQPTDSPSANLSDLPPIPPATGRDGPISARPTASKPSRFSQLFSTSPKAAKTASTDQPISQPLPMISVSGATTDGTTMDSAPKTIFEPPSAEDARRIARQHAQFGPLGHPSHRYVSKHYGGQFPEPVMDEPPYYYLLTTYISYLILIAFGHVRDFFGKRFQSENYRHLKPQNGYAALNSDFDNFYVRRLKLRINDCFERPVTGVPGRFITLIDRVSDDHNRHFRFTGTYTDTLNMSSYNYLGFAQSEGPCADAVEETIRKYGISAVSTRSEVGTQDLHLEVEDLVAKFKILVVVEGLYSMEGSLCNLPGILALKKKYKFNLFVDEAHSIGAIGPRGRGICDFFGIDTKHVDILMGTLTKSFGANGGYIAADKIIIDKLRATNPAVFYGETPTPPILAQISSSLRIITGELVPGQGEERLQRLAFNSRYLRLGLKRLGFIVYGNDDSPVIPLLLFNPAKMPAFSHEMLKRKISVVIVGYPATPLVSSRARFCVSAAHTKDDLDRLLAACDEIGNILQLKFSSGVAGGALPPPDGMTPEMEAEWYRQQAASPKGPAPPRWRYEDVIARGVQDTKRPLR